MKRQKDRITACQFDQALIEKIRNIQSLNIPRNAVASAMTFTESVGIALFGVREPSKRSPGYVDLLKKVIEDARCERATYDLEQRELAEAERRRIVMPGQPEFNKPPSSRNN